jgi:hypothetical protein
MAVDTKGGVMKVKGSRRIVRRLGLVLAVAAVFVPVAQAMPADPDVSGVISSSRVYADDLHAAVPVVPIRQYADDRHSRSPVSNVQVSSRRLYADDLHAPVSSIPRDYAPVNLQARPDLGPTRNYAPINTLARPDLYQPASAVVPADTTGFDWNDAGIGAGGALGLMLLLAGGALLAARHSRRDRLAAI